MSSFWADLRTPSQPSHESPEESNVTARPSRCSSFLEFLAISFGEAKYRKIDLHPVLTNSAPTFSDVSMGGISFDVRKVRASSFPRGLNDAAFEKREFVVVKQPRLNQVQSNALEEIATELQILRHPSLMQHANIIDFVGIVYHDANDDPENPQILPALVVEYAEFGHLRSYLAEGFGRTVQEKFDICQDVARGLDHLHNCGIVHCDVKDTNMLVCLDASTKKIVVKISDFGFAISLLDERPRLIGYTPYWEAPEIHEPLQRARLCQMDVYSYGLLFYTVMKDGALFYGTGQAEIPVETILKMKTSNFLPDLLQMNLLVHMKQERCMLLLFCKILVLCLQADIDKRFPSMNGVLELLKWCNPSDLSLEDHANEASYQMCNVPVNYYPDTKNRVLNLSKGLIDSYLTAVGTGPDLEPVLRKLFEERINVEIEMFIEKPKETDTERYWCCPVMQLMLVRSLSRVLLSKERTDEQKHVPQTNDLDKIHFCQDLDADLPQYHVALQKLHEFVKRYIFSELQTTLEFGDDEQNRASAAYNLSYCYFEGFGVLTDITKGLDLLRSAAVLGSSKARGCMIRIYTRGRRLEGLEKAEFVQWALETAQENYKDCLDVLRSLDLNTYSQLKKGWVRDRSLKLYRLSDRESKEDGHLIRDSAGSLTWMSKLLHIACTRGMTRLASTIVPLDTASITMVNSRGQTPFVVACQSGNLEIAILLLDHGADIDTPDVNGFTVLHWLISFSDSEKIELASHIAGGAEHIDAFGSAPQEATGDPSPNLQGGPLLTGTPLCWAVACRDLVAVDILMNMGADPFIRKGKSLSALELACSSHVADIIHRMLQCSAVRVKATQFEDFGSGNLTVNLMFWVVCNKSRFDSLVKIGPYFQEELERTMNHLVKVGVAVDSVRQQSPSDPERWSAPLATAFNQCHAGTMQAGLKNGFHPYLENTFNAVTSGGPAMSLAIAHNDRELLATLIQAGAPVTWKTRHKLSALSMVAKMTDDIWFAQKMLENGVPIDDPEDPVSPFFVATYFGNLRMAKFLWEKGAKRDRRDERGRTILCRLIHMKNRNAARCIRFILSLPDRDESDGFEVFHPKSPQQSKLTAFHLALNHTDEATDVMSEDPETIETSRLVMSLLLEKYSSQAHLNSKIGPHHDVALGAAVELGNHPVVRLLLEAGADPNAEDEYCRRPVHKLYWRYFYPTRLEYLNSVSPDDKYQLKKRLSHVNQNTSEIISLLKSYGAQPDIFRCPECMQSESGLRDAEWVTARLKEKLENPATASSDTPVGGGLPTTIPEGLIRFDD